MYSSIGQKAPSAKRCIKTRVHFQSASLLFDVRKHRAPKGALRHLNAAIDVRTVESVRKHRAPNGTLRLEVDGLVAMGGLLRSESTERQKVH